MPDAVFVEDERGELARRRLPKPTREEVQRAVERIARRARAMLRRELGDEEPQADALDRVRAGRRQGAYSVLPEPSEERSVKLAARWDGLSLEASRHLHEDDRRGLEALLQYCLRPSLAQERLSWASQEGGELVVRLKRPMAGGQTTLDLLRRLAVLVPPPQVHHLHDFGGFASPTVRRRCRPRAARAVHRAFRRPACRSTSLSRDKASFGLADAADAAEVASRLPFRPGPSLVRRRRPAGKTKQGCPSAGVGAARLEIGLNRRLLTQSRCVLAPRRRLLARNRNLLTQKHCILSQIRCFLAQNCGLLSSNHQHLAVNYGFLTANRLFLGTSPELSRPGDRDS